MNYKSVTKMGDVANLDIIIREADLEAKVLAFEKMNTELRNLLRQRDNDRKELEEKVIANIKLLISPNIRQLKCNLIDKKNQKIINVIEANLNNVVSPFAKVLRMKYSNLTNREIQVANLISGDKSTKDVADFLNISQSTVDTHIYRVRQKLGIDNRKNLRAFLSNLT